jgi:hypothetical protein
VHVNDIPHRRARLCPTSQEVVANLEATGHLQIREMKSGKIMTQTAIRAGKEVPSKLKASAKSYPDVIFDFCAAQALNEFSNGRLPVWEGRPIQSLKIESPFSTDRLMSLTMSIHGGGTLPAR